MAKVGILDDWQGVARSSADWSALAARADLTFFADAFATEDAAAEALADFDILLTMRERPAFPATLLRRLPKLRMIGITGSAVATLDVAAWNGRASSSATPPAAARALPMRRLSLRLGY